VCQGLAEARKVFARLGLQTASTSITLSGFLAERLGAIPQAGDAVEEGGHRFTVIRATARRASLVEIRPLEPGSENA
jgi:CBS domain containing-hemolysin-like protein